MSQKQQVERFEADNGAKIYRIPLELFPGFHGYVHVVLEAGLPTLVDTGSGFESSNDGLLEGFKYIREHYGEKLALEDIQRIIITHGHIDHFGGIAFMLDQVGGAQIGIHELDRRVLTSYEERVIMVTKDLRIFLERAGVNPQLRQSLMEMYGFAKQHMRSVPVHFSLEEDMLLDGLAFFHTPGHCPGQVCVRIGDILLSADHILARTTPHQSPESITRYNGLGHYLEALQKIERVDGLRLALGGHENPIKDIYGRIAEIRTSHMRKLNRVLDIIRDAGHPMTISDISKAMYPDKSGYEILLAIEEAGAHVEYLYQHGQLKVANLDKVEKEDNPALCYQLA